MAIKLKEECLLYVCSYGMKEGKREEGSVPSALMQDPRGGERKEAPHFACAILGEKGDKGGGEKGLAVVKKKKGGRKGKTRANHLRFNEIDRMKRKGEKKERGLSRKKKGLPTESAPEH